MALRGSLEEFDLAGVFQLIQGHKHSGILKVKSEQSQGWFSFHLGQLVLAGDSQNTMQNLLFRYLLARDPLKKREYKKIWDKEGKKSPVDFSQILLNENLMTSDELQKVAHQGLLDLACTIFTWKSGTYEFISQKEEHSKLLHLELAPDMLCMEAMRRLDHWEILHRTYPQDSIWLKNPDLLKNRKIEFESHSPIDYPAMHLLVLLDGSRTLGEALEESFLSAFRFWDIVEKLAQKRILVPLNEVAISEISPKDAVVSQNEPNTKTWMWGALSFVIAMFILYFISPLLENDLAHDALSETFQQRKLDIAQIQSELDGFKNLSHKELKKKLYLDQ